MSCHLKCDHKTYSFNLSSTICRQLGQSAIEIAAKKGHVDIVKVLIDRGADTKVTNNVSSISIQTDLK